MSYTESDLQKMLASGNCEIAHDLPSRKPEQAATHTTILPTKETALKRKPVGRSKYGNKKVEVDGIKFDSKREAARYKVLFIWQQNKLITDLKLQVKFELIPSTIINGKKQRPVNYIADFVYVENGKLTIEDCKGFRTPEYVIKCKMMKHLLGFEVTES